VDGDTDVSSVQQDFAAALHQLMHLASRKKEDNSHGPNSATNKGLPNGRHATNEKTKRGIPNGIAKQVNNISDHIGKVADVTKNINGVAQGNYLMHIRNEI